MKGRLYSFGLSNPLGKMNSLDGCDAGSFESVDNESLLHKSPNSSVYETKHIRSGKAVILKIIYSEHLQNNPRNAKREECMLAAISHPNIVSQYCSFLNPGDGNLILVLEKIEGHSLANCSVGRPILKGMIRDLSEAIKFLHRNRLVHRDIKPGNIMIAPVKDVKADDSSMSYKFVLIDFGLAVRMKERKDELKKKPAGTPGYLAYEVLSTKVNRWGRAKCGAEVDWYGLGLVIYESVTGERAFGKTDIPLAEFKDNLMFKDVRVKEGSDPINTLLAGLTERNHEFRWGYRKIMEWLQDNS